MKEQEQRSSFITIAINNANSTAAAPVGAGEREVGRGWDRGLQALGQGSESGGLGGPVARQSWRLQRSDRFMGQTTL